MSSKQNQDALAAQRAAAAAATDKNHPVNVATKGIRESGHHTEVIRQGNPGQSNQPKGK